MNGRIIRNIYAGLENGINNLQINLDDLPGGIYFIQVYEDGNFAFSGKVIKQK
jgi:hypothetical protein